MRSGQSPAGAGAGRSALAEFPSSNVLLAGLAVVAVGALAWYYLGPDLLRYTENPQHVKTPARGQTCTSCPSP